jgi:hypothetical protein
MADNLDINPTDSNDPTAAAKSLITSATASNIDSQTAQQLTNLTLIRQARINQQQREATALTAEYGATDPDVVALNTSISTQKSLTAVLGATRDIAVTTAPTVPTNGWVLHGRVRDNNLQPIATLSVCLVDEQKSWLSAYGYAYTDATGYFTLINTPAASSPAPSPLSAYLEVLNQSGQPLYIDSTAFTLNPGASLYRDIVLTSQTPLGSPPPGATPVKIPKPKKSAGSGGA